MTQHRSTEIPWFYPKVGIEEEKEVLEVLRSNYINDGQVTEALETQISEFLEVDYCVALTSGTVALSLSLMALGIGHGDEVIVPDFTFIATANAVRMTGAEVRLVDVEPLRFTIDPDRVEKAINPKTKGVIAVDVNGRSPDYDSLERLCKNYGIALVCDSAEAFGSKYKQRYLGTFGDAGCFSLSANKTMTSGQGGLFVTHRKDLYEKVKILKDQGRTHRGSGGDDLHPFLGYNFKYTNLQAAIAKAQLKKVPSRLEHFKNRDLWYQKRLQDASNITFPQTFEGEVLQWTDILCENRSQIEEILKSCGAGYRNFWFPLHRQAPYKQPDSGFENSLQISAKGLWLPSSFDLLEVDVESVCTFIKQGLVLAKNT
ncbi:MAG: DegT/DnrJ/EryC1/StrS family aminotransferase [Chlamydiia bacterium]|nr:DegT/DnrJ/EryC1/StrS family aminotransferase [Chlamydiia bacterium]